MASKKSIPSKKLISRHRSSSSFSLPSKDRFCDSESQKDFKENFYTRAIYLKHQVVLSDFPNTPLSDAFSSQGWESLYEKPSRCPRMFIQKFYSNIHVIDTFIPRFTTVFRGTHIVVTPNLITNVLHVLRIAHPNYLNHPPLRSISRDELALWFCELLISWGDTLNFTTHDFAKGPRIFNMVMIFVLTPRFDYNTITEPRARFLYSFLEDLSIDFPSHIIVLMIDIYRDTTTCDKLIFPSDITHILTYMHVPIPFAHLFPIMAAISQESM